MTRSKKHTSYPDEYYDIAYAIGRRENIELTFGTYSQAYSMKQNYYGFKGSIDKGEQQVGSELAGMIRAVRMSLPRQPNTEGKFVLTFMHTNDSPFAQKAREALAEAALRRGEALPSRREEPSTPQASPNASRPLFEPLDVDPTEDILARRLRHSRCSLCDPSLPCYEPGVPCVQMGAPRLGE